MPIDPNLCKVGFVLSKLWCFMFNLNETFTNGKLNVIQQKVKSNYPLGGKLSTVFAVFKLSRLIINNQMLITKPPNWLHKKRLLWQLNLSLKILFGSGNERSLLLKKATIWSIIFFILQSCQCQCNICHVHCCFYLGVVCISPIATFPDSYLLMNVYEYVLCIKSANKMKYGVEVFHFSSALPIPPLFCAQGVCEKKSAESEVFTRSFKQNVFFHMSFTYYYATSPCI